MARLLSFAAILAFGMTASPALPQTIQPVAQMRAKADAFVEKSYPLVGEDRRIHVSYADVNSDGSPEALVIVTDPKACGADPCALILDVNDDSAREIAALAGTDLRALQTKTGKWRDVMLDGKRLRWQDGTYK